MTSASSSLGAPMSPWTSPGSSNPSRRNSAATAGESPTSRRRVSRISIKPEPQPNDSNGACARSLGSRADDMDLEAWRRRIREYDEITNVGPIIRRYFVIGAFDGALTVLGIIIGASAFGTLEEHKALVLSASFGAAIALAVCSAVGAYEAERVEKKLDIRTIERAMLARLSEEHREAFQFAAILSAIVHGIAPLIAGLLPILPFVFLDARTATVVAVALTFQVRVPSAGVDAPFDGLRPELVPKDYIPTITQEKGETLVHVQRRPKGRFAGVQVNVALLLLTVLTIVLFGGAWNWADYSGKPILSAESIGYGAVFFSLPLFAILGCHEMGHYVVAKRYHVRASLPFFLPSVPPLGTLGAFISMRDPIPNRRALLDIGVSGPLVGFAIAIPVTLAGLALSTASTALPPNAVGEAIRPSILFSFLSLFFPLPSSFSLHPLAFAGWVGLFVTAINLLPAGQLDGGHVARAIP